MASSYLAPARGQGGLHQQGYARNRDEVRSISFARATKVPTAVQHRATHIPVVSAQMYAHRMNKPC